MSATKYVYHQSMSRGDDISNVSWFTNAIPRDRNVQLFEMKNKKPFKLLHATFNSSVRLYDILDHMHLILLLKIRHDTISKKKSTLIKKEIINLKQVNELSELRKSVFEWWLTEYCIISNIRLMGFDSVVGSCSASNTVHVVGTFDTKSFKKLPKGA